MTDISGIERALRARRAIDRRLQTPADLRERLATPAKGWIRAIRESLGMTASQLAGRMGLAQSSLSDLEKAEARGAIQLSSLRRAAEAMNCTLVYAFVPNEPLEEFVQRQARIVASEHLKPIEQTMLLENQSPSQEARCDLIDDYVRTKLNPKHIWNKP